MMRAKSNMRQQKDRLVAKLFSRNPSLLRRWARRTSFFEFNDSPWTPFDGDASGGRLALITTGGVHLRSQVPFDMRDPAGDPSFREIPSATLPMDLTITHNYYDHVDADKDVNIVLPIERVKDLKRAGDVGDVNHRHFSFMGHIMEPHTATLIKETAPQVARALKADEVDIVILTPA
jgi:D-proline reductase (dithiol) PrdB